MKQTIIVTKKELDEIHGAIAKYLTDNLIDIKDVKIGDSVVDLVVDYQASGAKRQIAKDEIVHWNTINSIKRRNNL